MEKVQLPLVLPVEPESGEAEPGRRKVAVAVRINEQNGGLVSDGHGLLCVGVVEGLPSDALTVTHSAAVAPALGCLFTICNATSYVAFGARETAQPEQIGRQGLLACGANTRSRYHHGVRDVAPRRWSRLAASRRSRRPSVPGCGGHVRWRSQAWGLSK